LLSECIDAECINPKDSIIIFMAEVFQGNPQVSGDRNLRIVDAYWQLIFGASPGV
jgi:hypothetical protein